MVRNLLKRLFRTSFAVSERSFYFNTLMRDNLGWFVYAILSVAILLQQFPLTEPLVVGFFWITLLSLIMSTIANAYEIHDARSIAFAVFMTVSGIALQVYLIVFRWSSLVEIDSVLRDVRTAAFGNHLYFGWGLWGVCTAYVLYTFIINRRSSFRRSRPSGSACV